MNNTGLLSQIVTTINYPITSTGNSLAARNATTTTTTNLNPQIIGGTGGSFSTYNPQPIPGPQVTVVARFSDIAKQQHAYQTVLVLETFKFYSWSQDLNNWLEIIFHIDPLTNQVSVETSHQAFSHLVPPYSEPIVETDLIKIKERQNAFESNLKFETKNSDSVPPDSPESAPHADQ